MTHATRCRALLLGTVALVALLPLPAAAQDRLTAVVLRGRSAAPGAGTPASDAPAPLMEGMRVESPARSWTEIAFSDGSSILLGPGTDFTLRGLVRDPMTGRPTIRGQAQRGRLRLTTSDRADIVLGVPEAEVKVSGASAVAQAGPGPGAVTLLTGQQVKLRAASGCSTSLRRPGFRATFDCSAPVRQSAEALAAELDFAVPGATGRDRAGERLVAAAISVEDLDRARRQSGHGPNDAIAPPVTQPGGRASGPALGFGVAANVSAGSGFGTAVAAPGFSTLASSTDASVLLGVPTGGQEPDSPIIGMVERRSLGTTRLRRFSPVFSGTLTGANPSGTRADAGTVSAAGGTTSIPSAQFQNLTGQQLAVGTNAANPNFYDAVANLFVVNLQLVDPSTKTSGGPTPPQDPLRFSVTDQTRPTVTRPPGSFIALRQLPGQQQSTILRDQFGQPRYFNSVDTNPNNPGNNFVFIEVGTNQRLRTASGTDVQLREFFPQGTQEDVTVRAVQSAYRAGSVFDVPVRPANTPTKPPESAVFQLAGGNGLSVTRNASIPDATLALPRTSGLTLNPDPMSPDPKKPQSLIAREDGVPGPFKPGQPRPTKATSVAPGVSFVTIIDKVTEGSEAITSQRGIQPGERFFTIGGSALPVPASGGFPGAGAATLAPGTVVRYAVSDGLNPLGPDGRPNINQPGGFRADCGDGCTVAQQFLSPDPAYGRPRAFSSYNAFRPEESFVPGAARGDTHLLVTAGQGNRHPAMRVDLQVAANGLSSAGVSVGGLLALPEGGGLALSGVTVGSARLGLAGSQTILGNLGSLATSADAYGAHVFPNTDPTIATARGGGDLGHFAIGESDPRVGAPNRPPPVQPGSVQPVGGSSSVPFGFTRLATNVGAVTGLTRTEDGRALQGFAAGFAEVPRGDGTVGLHAVTGDDPGSFVLSRAANANEFTAQLRVSPIGLGELSSDPDAARAATGAAGQRVLAFGGSGPTGAPTTAFAADSTFAAVVPQRASLASVDADTLAGITGGSALPPSNEHAAWGLFLGDLVPQGSPGAPPREYVGLGFWVAGRLVDPSVLSTLTGVASYRGGMIGTAAEAGRIAAVAGSFTHQWNFARRTGQFDASFDGRGYSAPVSMPQGGAVFAGTGPSGDRTLAVRGAFFNAGAMAGGVPAAVGGNFGIRGPGYGANGIFIGAPGR